MALPSSKKLSVFNLVMINVIAIDSLRTLPISAEYGFSLVFFYLFAGLTFFLPVALVTAELATTWPKMGGAYVWIKKAFGPFWGFLSIWFMWIYNVVWYPTIFSFIAAAIAYLISPALAHNAWYMVLVVLSAFWSVTALNCFGLRASDWLNTVGVILGTLIPMGLIIVLGVSWCVMGAPIEIELSVKSFLPHVDDLEHAGYFLAILFGLMGLEMSAIHAGDVDNPKRDFPKALVYSVVIILLTLTLSSLAIALVVSPEQLDLVTGFFDAFKIFLAAYHLESYIDLIVLSVIIGSLACAGAWMLGPSRALSIALQDTNLPSWMHHVNHYNAPISVLLIQGVFTTLLALSLLLMPSVSEAYWFLSALSAQLALLFYVLLFAAAIKLRFSAKNQARVFAIPFGKLGMIIVGGVGILCCFIGILVGFVPPSDVLQSPVWYFVGGLIFAICLLCLPILFIRFRDVTDLD